MGWNYTRATNYTANGAVDRKKEMDKRYNWSDEKTAVSVVKSCMVKGVYYAALSIMDKEKCTVKIVGEVVLTDIAKDDYCNFGYKAMSETIEPFYYDCPESILKLLDCTTDESALKWREKCWENIKKKKSPNALNNLPIGAVIRYTMSSGKTIELRKHPAAYQFKRPFWFCDKSSGYVPVTHIPDNYEVISA